MVSICSIKNDAKLKNKLLSYPGRVISELADADVSSNAA